MIIEEIKLQEGISETSLTAYLQDSLCDRQELIKKPAVILCPGGAFLGYTEKESEPVALRFLSEGYQVFILRYSIGDTARFPTPFIDVAKAVKLIREHASHWGIHPDNISLCGFSTGAHVVAAYGAMWQEEFIAKALNTDNNILRPNAILLGYPVLDLDRFLKKNRDMSQEMDTLIEMMSRCIYGTASPTQAQIMEWDIRSKIKSGYPPTFLWTTMEDSLIDVEESLDFIKVLDEKGIPYEYHIFQKGSHGSSLGNKLVGFSEDEIRQLGNTPRWTELALHWLNDII